VAWCHETSFQGSFLLPQFKRDRPLTRQQQVFVKTFIANGLKGASHAFRMAYPASEKWSSNAVRVEASRLLRHPRIHLTIEKARASGDRSMKRAFERYSVSRARIVQRLAHIAFSDIGDVLQWDQNGRVKVVEFGELPEAAAAAIRKVRSGPSGTTVEMNDPLAALVALARLHGMLP
jgi:hypothetical protein